MDARTGWEQEADNWVRWARAPGDAYWYYRDSFFDRIVPSPGRRTIEIGCGEGRVARDLILRGHRVTALDSSPTLLRYARNADPQGTYLLADAAALPFSDGAFDLAVAYNSLMDVDDMPGAVREVARVLSEEGRVCVCVTHPINDSGSFAGEAPDAPFTIVDSYFGRRRFQATFERDGLTMTFHGWSYALQDYAEAFEEAGLLIETLREPGPDATSFRYEQWHRLPLFLHLRAVKS